AVSSSQIDLDWDDNTEPDLDSYSVYRDGGQIASGVASSSYSDTGLSASTQYCYTVTAVDTSSNESTESAQDCATTQSGPGPGDGDGLTGDYYDNMDFTSHALTRVDATVNFDWGSGSPDPSMGADTFSVRWTGQVEPLYSETYTFKTLSDDGVRLWVDGQQVIDNWTDHGPTEDTGTISLSAGTKYDVQLDYYENAGGAVIELYWSSASQTEEIIPQSQLYSTTGSGGSTTLNPVADDSPGAWCTDDILVVRPDDEGFMKFDLSSVGTPVSSATLRVYSNNTQYVTMNVSIWDATTDGWEECGTLPGKGSNQLDSVATGPEGEWLSFDVTGYVDAEASGDGTATFCLAQDFTGWQQYRSRESTDPPELVVQW
ncbi:MAG: PA14 domain-containing protein, partial [Candidatus Brocadiia bacterium]